MSTVERPTHSEIRTSAIEKLKLHDSRSEDMSSFMDGCVGKDGDLVIDCADIGEKVKQIWGDYDYEWWITVRREHVPKVLLLLIKERFANKSEEFREWLKGHNIPSEFDSWV